MKSAGSTTPSARPAPALPPAFDTVCLTALLAGVLESTTDAIWVKDREGVYQLINHAGAAMLGADPATVIGRTDDDLLPAHSCVALHVRDLAVLDSGEPRSDVAFAPRSVARGERMYTTVRTPLNAADGRVVGLLGVSRDITDHRDDEEAARAREARIQVNASQLPAILWSTDADLRLTSCTGAGLAELGLAADRTLGIPLEEAFHSHDSESRVVTAARRALLGESSQLDDDWNGRTYETHVAPLRDAQGEIVGALGVSVDVTHRRRLDVQLTHQALHDPLTGLVDRALFRDRIERAIARCAAWRGSAAAVADDGSGMPAASPVAVVYLDLDDFNSVNESLGHAIGDEVLRQVAGRLLSATRGCDTVARLGGDEFAVLLEGMSADNDAAKVVDRIAGALRAPFHLRNRQVSLVVTLGVAYARSDDPPAALMRNADVAMSTAKASGKGRHAVFDPAMHTAVVERLELEADLRLAVDALDITPDDDEEPPSANGQPACRPSDLRLVYQPLVNLADGGVVSFEALLRWTRCGAESVSPATFIPLAEAAGLIVPLSRWVLREACAQLAEWRAMLPERELRVAVNISGHHLEPGAGLLDHVQSALARAALPGDALTIEITERTLMRRTEATMERLAALKALGVRLAIDDFGTGYSSLAYLKKFDVDVLKIDKTFVDGVADGADDAAIARMIVMLSTTLGLHTVAEGVEREDQRSALAALGCDFGQGYLFARPLEVDAAAQLVSDQRSTLASAYAPSELPV